ncbi:hypothetical protein CEP51_002954 [Fusarium floridanum]|uniref:Zn(2)-C6 fungal-type domain-containing protein n=1 Tax=Fusarium floridanum TaxID=1325733 RepID=A0A428S8K9_9HYPO|nr:hypothetical protein CEP51_002954 [Fusarium floridanum]
MPLEKAHQACRACRRLKRRCTKDLPSCSLVRILGLFGKITNISSVSVFTRHVNTPKEPSQTPSPTRL